MVCEGYLPWGRRRRRCSSGMTVVAALGAERRQETRIDADAAGHCGSTVVRRWSSKQRVVRC